MSESESSQSSSSKTKQEEQKLAGKKLVKFDKGVLNSRNKSNVQERRAEVEVPELNGIMGLKEGEVATMIVRQLYFDELIETQRSQFDFMRNLVEGIVEAVASKKAVKEEVEDALTSKNRDVGQKIDVVETCLVEPKLTRQEINYIAKMWPTAVLRLYNSVMDITNRGADLKKNSSG